MWSLETWFLLDICTSISYYVSKSWSTCTLLYLNSKNSAQKVCHAQASYRNTKHILVQNLPRQLKTQRNIHYIFNCAATSFKENRFFNDIVKVKAYQYNLLNNFSTLNKAYSKGECSVRRLMTHGSPFCTSTVHYYTIHKPPTFISAFFHLIFIFLSLTGRNWRRPTTTCKVASFTGM